MTPTHREQAREMTWQEAEDLNTRLAALLETMPAPVSARVLRDRETRFAWADNYYAFSDAGFWRAEIGTDHGSPEDDDLPVRWRPALEFHEDPAAMLALLEGMRGRGWLSRTLETAKTWPLRCAEIFWEVELRHPESGRKAQGTAATLPQAVVLAALAALEGA